jgi:hypothetical protein
MPSWLVLLNFIVWGIVLDFLGYRKMLYACAFGAGCMLGVMI